MRAATSSCLAFSASLVAACGGPPPSSAEPPAVVPTAHLDDVAHAKVFDERGTASSCEPPRAACPQLPVSSDFLDRCRMSGFQVRKCGCDARCSGDVSAAGRHYDAEGHVKDCAPASADCTPPPASGAFQDACSERGFRLETCGCEWLCSGNFKK